MAVMLPGHFPEDHSRAEFRIFRKLRDETPHEWTALHSVGLSRHARKAWAEADFVVLTDRAILCLEVKGGAITVDHGTWYTNRKRLTHSPFEQAGGAAGALSRFLREQDLDQTPVVGWAVAFPDCPFDIDAPWARAELTYDERRLTEPIHLFIDRALDDWIRKESGEKEVPTRLARDRREALIDLLAPTFCLQPTLRARIEGAREGLVRLTEQQIEVIRGFEDTDRLLVRGGAGSGKTMLALAEAERLADRGTDVLLLCTSGPLSRELRTALGARPRVEVRNAVELAAGLVADAGLQDEIPDSPQTDFLAMHLPETALRAAERTDHRRFGALIIDEAQDLISPNWIKFFDRLLDDGFQSGVWRVFIDPNQDLLLSTSSASLDALEDQAVSRYRLTLNCRNTKQVAVATRILSGLASPESLHVEGPEVEWIWYGTDREQRSRAAATVRDWLAGGLEPRQIVVLAEEPLPNTVFAHIGADELGAPLVDAGRGPSNESGVRFATVRDFKGLEADAVLVLGVDDLSPGDKRLQLYVAMTRACASLCVMLHRDTEQKYDELVSDHADRVRQGVLPW